MRYLESLSESHLKVVFVNIVSINETSIICDEGKGPHAVDVLVCVTVFDTTFKH